MAPTIPATPKLLRVRPEAPPLLPELLLFEGEEPLEVLVELLWKQRELVSISHVSRKSLPRRG